MADNKVKILVEAEDQASTKLKSIGASFGSLAKIAVWAIGAISITQGIQASIQAMNDQVRVNTQLESVLKSTNNAVWLSSQAIQDMASNLQSLTTMSDDTIQTGQNMLLTFTNIGKDVFPQATATLLDMAVAMNGGVTPSAEALSAQAIQLGKALNDPINGISSLSRVGVTFTEGQKGMIESLVKTGETAKAQQIILAELNREFGGSAQAQAQTFAGKMAQLGNAVGDIAEIIGFALLPALTAIANKLKVVALQAVQFFNDNAQVITQFGNDIYNFFIDILWTIISTMKTTFSVITEVFSSIFWNAKQTGIGIWDVFRAVFTGLAIGFRAFALGVQVIMRTVALIFRGVLLAVRGIVLSIIDNLGSFVGTIATIIEKVLNKVIDGINLVFKALGKSVIEPITSMSTAFSSFKDEMKAQNQDLTDDATKAWDDFASGMTGDIQSATESMIGSMDNFSSQVNSTGINLKGLALDGSMGMGKLADATGNASKAAKWHNDELKKLTENAQKIVTDITEKVKDSQKAVDEAREAVKKKTEEWAKYRQEWVKALSDVNNEIKKLRAEASDIEVRFKVSQDEKLADRYLEIQKEIADAQKTISSDQGGNIVSPEAYTAMQKITDLTKERELIERGVNKSVLENAAAYDKMSQTEKIILDLQKEKNKALEENKQKLIGLQEKQTLLQIQADQQSIKDLKINTDLKDGMITATYTNELGKKQEIHDYENVQLALQIAEKQKNFADEMAILDQNLQTKLSKEKSVLEELKVAYANHNAFLKSDTKSAAEAMIGYLKNVANELRTVIALRREAWTSGNTPTWQAIAGARAVWWAVSANKAYLVWEREAEIFVPNSAWRIIPGNQIASQGITVTFWNITINTGIDMAEFENKIYSTITRASELSKLWIS